MAQKGSFDRIAASLARLFLPLRERIGAGDVRLLLAELGVQFPPSIDSNVAFTNAANDVVQRIEALPDLIISLQALIENEDIPQIISKTLELADAIRQVIQGLENIANNLDAIGGASGIPAAELHQFCDELPGRVLNYLIVRKFESIPTLANLFDFIGFIERVNVAAIDATHPSFVRRALHVDGLINFLTHPADQLRTLYGWGDASFDGLAMLQKLQQLLTRAGIPAILDQTGPVPVLDLVILEIEPKLDVNPRGLHIRIVEPIQPNVAQIYARDDWQVTTTLNIQFHQGMEIILQPDDSVTMKPPGGEVVQGNIEVEWTAGKPGGTPYLLLGEPGGSRLDAKQLVVGAKMTLVWDLASNSAKGVFRISGEVKEGHVSFSLSKADGFIGSILSGVAFDSDFSVGIEYSTARGLTFIGSDTLDIQLPLHTDLGPVEVNALTLSAGIAGSTFPLGIRTNLKASLGPLQASIDQIGVGADVSLRDHLDGNIGPVDFTLNFLPPKGVGLSIDASIIKGGGYLSFDPDKEEYAGVMELSIADIVTVKAIGLITTRMPDGSKGFSLLIIISAEFGSGIQIGFGFTLLGVGGLLGLNRSMSLEPIASGIRTGAINSIMFPPDPIANISRIISDLRTFFPPNEGVFLIGPMMKFGWGTPTLISLSLGVIIEIPGDIAIVGVLHIALPEEDAPIIVINVGFIGAIEFDKSRIWFFAAMFDSRILFMTMEGDMGLLMDFSDNPNFVLSVGGFHPQFNPPPLPFPNPRRIHIDVLRNPLARITVENYFAITSNTVQFGARAELFYGVDDFNIHGNFSFDALFQFSPFHFIIDISFSVGMDVFGVGVFSVSLKLKLAGPAPWEARGTATLSIDLWLFSIDISVDFDIKWGDADNPTIPAAPAIPLLVGEFNKADNWRAQLPENVNLLVSLRKLDLTTEGLVLHPVGSLRISQRTIPLGIHIDKVGNKPVSDAHMFSVDVSGGGLAPTANPPQEKFAIAQFQNLSDADKLSRRSFEDIAAGVELECAGRQLGSSKVAKRIVRYEVKIMDGDDKFNMFRWFSKIGTLFYHWLGGAAVTKSTLSYARKKAMVPTLLNERVKVAQPQYVVAGVEDNKAKSGAPDFATESHASDYLNAQISAHPELADQFHVIPKFEATPV